jgi:hypothetical protein
VAFGNLYGPQRKGAIPFSRKTNSISFIHHVDDLSILCTDYVKYYDVMFDGKIYFHQPVRYTFSEALKFLGLICFTANNYFSCIFLRPPKTYVSL